MKLFNQLAAKRPPQNKFDLTHEKKMSLNMGDLVPILCQEIVPGDKFRVSTEVFLRMAPMLSPIMHRVNVYVHYFFVPNRIVDSTWEMFITRGRNGEQAPVAPHFQINNVGALELDLLVKGTLWDYLGGKPVADVAGGADMSTQKISALPFRAYQKIYDDYYRDPTLTAPLFQSDTVGGTPPMSIDGGNITDASELENLLTTRKRAWEKDYFTSALPWSQRGADVQIPIDGLDVNYKKPSILRAAGSDADLGDIGAQLDGTVGYDGAFETPSYIDNIESIEGYGLTVNELRTTIKLQEWFEKNARAGYRYIEQILSHFGVRSSDARLQRTEYLGGGKIPVKISEVLSTFGSDSVDSTSSNVGEMAGHGVSYGQSNRFKKSFEEHGFVIGIMSILPRTNYQDGLPRFMTARDTWDKYYWPEFAHLGEQPILNSELFFDPESDQDGDGPTQNSGTFGYQSRYCEYKYGISTVHGDFRDSLDFWHMGRKFSTLPSLNAAFVEADPTHRIFPVTDEGVDKIYCHVLNKIDAIRPMPYFGIPTI